MHECREFTQSKVRFARVPYQLFRRSLSVSASALVIDAMAEAMIRSCPKCKLRYYKGEACNK